MVGGGAARDQLDDTAAAGHEHVAADRARYSLHRAGDLRLHPANASSVGAPIGVMCRGQINSIAQKSQNLYSEPGPAHSPIYRPDINKVFGCPDQHHSLRRSTEPGSQYPFGVFCAMQ